jgi:hypothetical protein
MIWLASLRWGVEDSDAGPFDELATVGTQPARLLVPIQFGAAVERAFNPPCDSDESVLRGIS